MPAVREIDADNYHVSKTQELSKAEVAWERYRAESFSGETNVVVINHPIKPILTYGC
jgi:hypothetical protein